MTGRPGLPAEFKLPRTNGYQTLLATARAFAAKVDPLKAELVASGLDADFDTNLSDLVAEFASALELQNSGRVLQVGGTAGLSDEARKGARLIAMLDSIMGNLLKTETSLLAAWNSASHIERPPKRKEDDEGPVAPTPPATLMTEGEGI